MTIEDLENKLENYPKEYLVVLYSGKETDGIAIKEPYKTFRPAMYAGVIEIPEP